MAKCVDNLNAGCLGCKTNDDVAGESNLPLESERRGTYLQTYNL